MHKDMISIDEVLSNNKIVCGKFDGKVMCGEDGKFYPVPANYASKSRLVEGDILKLTVTKEGEFIYKQIEKVPVGRFIGKVVINDWGKFSIKLDKGDKIYKIATAAVTYFNLEVGDEVIAIMPKNIQAQFAVIDNVINKNNI